MTDHVGDIHAHSPTSQCAPKRLLDAPGISIDRMPMLHVIFDRMAAQCSENLAPALRRAGILFGRRHRRRADRRCARRLRQTMSPSAFSRFRPGTRAFWSGWTTISSLRWPRLCSESDGGEAPLAEQRKLSSLEIRLAQKTFESVWPRAAKRLRNGLRSRVQDWSASTRGSTSQSSRRATPSPSTLKSNCEFSAGTAKCSF